MCGYISNAHPVIIPTQFKKENLTKNFEGPVAPPKPHPLSFPSSRR